MTNQTEMSVIDKWDRHFLRLAREVSLMSKDPSTKVGAVIVRPDRSIASTGYNGFPKSFQRFDDNEAAYADRDHKLTHVIHAEMNAILHLKGEPISRLHTIYVYPCQPCPNCMKHIIQIGVRRIISVEPPESMKDRWAADFKIAFQMFHRGGGDHFKLYEKELLD